MDARKGSDDQRRGQSEMSIEDFNGYTKCVCGAVSIFANDGRVYSCKCRNLKKYAPFIDLRKLKRYQTTCCCDHCTGNHFGLDLCGCGSGEPFGRCKNHLPECNRPMQMLNEYDRVICGSCWLA